MQHIINYFFKEKGTLTMLFVLLFFILIPVFSFDYFFRLNVNAKIEIEYNDIILADNYQSTVKDEPYIKKDTKQITQKPKEVNNVITDQKDRITESTTDEDNIQKTDTPVYINYEIAQTEQEPTEQESTYKLQHTQPLEVFEMTTIEVTATNEHFDTKVKPTLNITLPMEYINFVDIKAITDNDSLLLLQNINGLIGGAYTIGIDQQFESAYITYEFIIDENTPSEFEPRIFILNPETQSLEQLPNQVILDNNKISAKIEQSCEIVLINTSDTIHS